MLIHTCSFNLSVFDWFHCYTIACLLLCRCFLSVASLIHINIPSVWLLFEWLLAFASLIVLLGGRPLVYFHWCSLLCHLFFIVASWMFTVTPFIDNDVCLVLIVILCCWCNFITFIVISSMFTAFLLFFSPSYLSLSMFHWITWLFYRSSFLLHRCLLKYDCF